MYRFERTFEARRPSRRHPRSGARVVRAISPANIGASSTRARLSGRFRNGAHRGGLSRRADPGRIWRRGPPLRRAAAILEEIQHAGGNAARLPRADVHHGHAPAARHAAQKQRYLPGIAAARCGCRPSASPSRRPAPTRRSLRPRARARATTTSSTARRSGPRARSIPT